MGILPPRKLANSVSQGATFPSESQHTVAMIAHERKCGCVLVLTGEIEKKGLKYTEWGRKEPSVNPGAPLKLSKFCKRLGSFQFPDMIW